MAGGMMRFGIPAYRMPRDILDGEVARLEKLGIRITLNCKVEDVMKAKEEDGFDAVFGSGRGELALPLRDGLAGVASGHAAEGSRGAVGGAGAHCGSAPRILASPSDYLRVVRPVSSERM